MNSLKYFVIKVSMDIYRPDEFIEDLMQNIINIMNIRISRCIRMSEVQTIIYGYGV